MKKFIIVLLLTGLVFSPTLGARTAITFVTGSNAATALTTGAINSSGADFGVVEVACYQAGTPGAVTDSKSNSGWTGGTVYRNGVDNQHLVRLYYTKLTSVGASHTATVASCASPEITWATFSGVRATNPFDKEAGGSDGGSISMTPTEANSLIVTGYGNGCNGPATGVNSGFTLTGNAVAPSTNMGGGEAYLVQTTPAAVNPAFTGNSLPCFTAKTQAAFKAETAAFRPIPVIIRAPEFHR